MHIIDYLVCYLHYTIKGLLNSVIVFRIEIITRKYLDDILGSKIRMHSINTDENISSKQTVQICFFHSLAIDIFTSLYHF